MSHNSENDSSVVTACGCIGGVIGAIALGGIIPLILLFAHYGNNAALISIFPSILLGFLLGWIISVVVYHGSKYFSRTAEPLVDVL